MKLHALVLFWFALASHLLSAESSAVAVLPGVTAQASEMMPLWPGRAPGETVAMGPEHVLPDRPRPFDQITDVSVPTLAVFLPPPTQRNGTAMLVIPGGGLERLALEHEGYEVAAWLNAQGIAAFILKYRVPPRDPAQRWKVGLQDAQRAMSLIRSRAAEWKLDPEALGTIGFSAGGEINVMLSVYAERQYPPLDDSDRQPTRPAFNIVLYGGGFADVKTNALRPDIASRIDAQTPPMFLVHAFDDGALSSVILMNALKRASVPSELHLFGAGGHGFGVRDSGLPVAHWRELCLNWLRWLGYLDAAPIRAFAREYQHAFTSGSAQLPRFTAALPDSDLAQAYAAQRRLVRATVAQGGVITGYKGAFTSATAQKANAVPAAQHGVLFRDGWIETQANPVVVKPDANRPLLVETEIGYVIAVDIGTKILSPRQALSAVEALRPVIELPVNAGSLMPGKANGLDLIAANVGSSRYLVGPPLAPAVVGTTDTLPIKLQYQGETLHESTGADVTGGQAQNLMNLINEIIDQGHVLHRGDLIICGALGGAKPGKPGHYRADYGTLGAIDFSIEP